MSNAMKPVELPENWLQQSMAEAAITVECFAKADAEAKRLMALLDKRVEQAGSDATNERPVETTYEIQTSDGVAIDRDRVAAVIAALQADCERWSGLYARQADELAAVKAQLKDVSMVADVGDMTIEAARKHITTLKARLAEVEGERNALQVTGGSTNPFVLAEKFARISDAKFAAEQRAEAAERRVAELEGEMEAHRRTYGSNLNLP